MKASARLLFFVLMLSLSLTSQAFQSIGDQAVYNYRYQTGGMNNWEDAFAEVLEKGEQSFTLKGISPWQGQNKLLLIEIFTQPTGNNERLAFEMRPLNDVVTGYFDQTTIEMIMDHCESEPWNGKIEKTIVAAGHFETCYLEGEVPLNPSNPNDKRTVRYKRWIGRVPFGIVREVEDVDHFEAVIVRELAGFSRAQP